MRRMRNKPIWLAHVIASYVAYPPVLLYQLYYAPLYPTARHVVLYAFLALCSPVIVPFSAFAQIFLDRFWWWGNGNWREAVFAYTYLFAFICVYFLAGGHEKRRKLQLVGHCTQCEYDLRASPEFCPECGAAVESEPHEDPSNDIFSSPIPKSA